MEACMQHVENLFHVGVGEIFLHEMFFRSH
jgi:hypothetical protein